MKRRFNLLGFRSSVTGKNGPQIAGADHECYDAEFCKLMNRTDPRVPCDYGCEWIPPYGWVPNASCPLHD